MNENARGLANYLRGTDRCSCPDVADILRAELSGRPPSPCTVHNPDARKADAEVVELAARTEAHRAIVRDLRPHAPARSEKDELTYLVGMGLAGVNIQDAEAAFMASFSDTPPDAA